MSCNRSSLLATAGLLTVILSFLANPVRAETLGQAVEAALNYHPSVEAAFANREAFAEERREKWADHFPSLNVRGAGGRIFGDNSTSRGLSVTRGEAYSYLWEGSVTLTQPIFNGFETFNRVDAAQMRRDSADYNISDVRESLALRAVITYLDVLRSRESLKRIIAHNKKIEDYQKRIQSMVDEGAADESMIVQARDIKKQLESTMTDIEGQLKASDAEYLEIVGHLPEGDMSKPVPSLDLIPEVVGDAISFAKSNHPSLKAAIHTEQALSYDAEAEKQFYYPDVNGELSYLERDQVDEIGGETIDAKAVVRLNWDLSLAGGQVAKVKKAERRYHESKAQRAETERTIERDIRMAFSDFETAKKRVGLQQDRVKINEDLFKNYEAQFEGARINLLQLLQADNALFNARLTLMNGEYTRLASEFAVLASMGRLQESLSVVPVEKNGK